MEIGHQRGLSDNLFSTSMTSAMPCYFYLRILFDDAKFRWLSVRSNPVCPSQTTMGRTGYKLLDPPVNHTNNSKADDVVGLFNLCSVNEWNCLTILVPLIWGIEMRWFHLFIWICQSQRWNTWMKSCDWDNNLEEKHFLLSLLIMSIMGK
jgi:hypothetical protein